MLTRDGYCTSEIKMRIPIAKEAFNRKISLSVSKLNIELMRILVRCYVWSIALYGSEIWTLRTLERKHLKSFEMCCWRRKYKIKRLKRLSYEVLKRIGEKRTLLNNILRRKVSWIGHILR